MRLLIILPMLTLGACATTSPIDTPPEHSTIANDVNMSQSEAEQAALLEALTEPLPIMIDAPAVDDDTDPTPYQCRAWVSDALALQAYSVEPQQAVEAAWRQSFHYIREMVIEQCMFGGCRFDFPDEDRMIQFLNMERASKQAGQ